MRSRLVTRGVMALMVILALVVGYAAVADIAYSRVTAVAEPCRDCATPATVNGYQLYYRQVGTDTVLPPVVLVHGGPGHSSLSFKQSFDFLAAHRRVIYWDQRGSGNSEAKADPDDYTLEKVVEDLEALRRDVVRAEKVVVVGHSFGGAVAQRYALAHPERVARLVLIGSVRINNGISSHAFWRWFGPALWSTAMGFPPADPAKADSTFFGDAGDLDRLFDKRRAHEVLDGTGRIRFTTWRELSFSAPGKDYVDELRRLRVPTTVIYGAADSPYTGKPTAEALCGILPDCRVIGFERSGHWPFLEEPERFREVMTSLLAP